MPWSPTDVRKKYKKLTKKQSEVWAKVANSSLEAGDDEVTAIKKANAAVRQMRKTEAMSEAASLLVEAGRMISAANMKTLKTAMQSMKAAMDSIMPLMGDSSDEEEEEVSEVATWESANLEEAAKILAQADSYDSVRCAVQQALRQRALSNALAQKVAAGDFGYDDYYYGGGYPYIHDLYDGYVVYSLSGELYQCEYTIDENNIVTLSDEVEVKVSYVPVTTSDKQEESIDLKGDLVVLQEKAIREDGTARICLITPGWGSSGYYSKEMLKRDGPKVFKKGTHMYMNHPTEEEDRVRPERDVRDLAGVIASDVVWEEHSSNNIGPGLYADVKVFQPYKEFIDEAAPHIGTSIRAAGTAKEGEAENRHGLLVDSLKEGYSVDYVTVAGRGGQILSLYESARSRVNVEKVKGLINMEITKEELDSLRESAKNAATLETRLNESNALIQKMRDALVLSEARNVVSETLVSIQMPDVVREKLRESCLRTVPLTETRELDRDKFVENIKEAAAAELKYIEAVTGSVTGGKVVGMTQKITTELNAEEVDKNLGAALQRLGLSDKAAAIAVNGRN
jgi:uncharacterized protein YdaT